MVASEKMGAEDDSSDDNQYYDGEEEGEEELGGHSYIACAGEEESVVDGAVFLMSFRANKPLLSGDSGDVVSSVCNHCGYSVFLDFSSFCCFSLLQGSHLGSSCDLQFVPHSRLREGCWQKLFSSLLESFIGDIWFWFIC